ncbi:NAD(P)/FAD-dependent oxidoreductase [Streptomyces monashensis]|uniref:FAD-dependent oxidoreductase n=1 Tax=Streptomyces monashensis TaxID=1678012 RepID=A0A1S2Q718_9ACTN|nr:FAD-dependent oxidoreductase [Streptomyces monashensis]OIK01015.1 FAD-dependent oxidoreductase [Streptomyces monashensis]
MSAPESVLVVGASAAGLATAESLRRKGFQGTLTVLGAERHLPYDRPPLSKQVLSGAWPPERIQLRGRDELDALDAEFVLGDPAVSLDAATRTVSAASGWTRRTDVVVLATGIRPRPFPGAEGLRGVHVLRTLEDAVALRGELAAAARVVVVGDGVLGSEIAATARGLGVAVTLVGRQATPMASQLGPRAAGLLGRTHSEHGVRLLIGASVERVTSRRGRVCGVRLGTGEVLAADVVVVAIGSVPVTDWLEDSGLVLDNGVVCDSRCRATAEGIYAVGDVARWHHEGIGAMLRLENRTNATEQAGAVAGNILGEDRPYTPVPYFWTDQFNAKIQVHGTLAADADVEIVEGSESDRRFVALYRNGGRPTGVLGWNMPKQTRLHRQALVDAADHSLTLPR